MKVVAVILGIFLAAIPLVNANYRVGAVLICESGETKQYSADCCTVNTISIGFTTDGPPCTDTVQTLGISSLMRANWPCISTSEIHQLVCDGNTKPAIIYKARNSNNWVTTNALTCGGLRGGEAIGMVIVNSCPFDDQCSCGVSENIVKEKTIPAVSSSSEANINPIQSAMKAHALCNVTQFKHNINGIDMAYPTIGH